MISGTFYVIIFTWRECVRLMTVIHFLGQGGYRCIANLNQGYIKPKSCTICLFTYTVLYAYIFTIYCISSALSWPRSRLCRFTILISSSLVTCKRNINHVSLFALHSNFHIFEIEHQGNTVSVGYKRISIRSIICILVNMSCGFNTSQHQRQWWTTDIYFYMTNLRAK